MSNQLSLRLSAVEILQHEGHRLNQMDLGVLAARRHGNPAGVDLCGVRPLWQQRNIVSGKIDDGSGRIMVGD